MLGKEIQNLVIVKLEEYTPYGPQSGKTLLAGGDSLDEVKPIYSYVSQHLAEAANEILLTAPIHRLLYKTDANIVATPDDEDKHIGSINLPSDFLRLHTLRMEGWSRPLHDMVNPSCPVYRLQFNRWTRGTKQKPVAILDGRGLTKTQVETDNDGKVVKTNTVYTEQPILRYFSVDASDEHTIKEFKYVSKFDQYQDYEREVAELISLHCARKVCEVFGMTEQVGILTNEINSVLENIRL